MALLGSGCGTDLVVAHAWRDDAGELDGVVVNVRTAYDVAIEKGPGFETIFADQNLSAVPQTSRILGIRHRGVATIDICRMPFASGKLSLVLTPDGCLKTVGVTSETGAVRAIEGATTVIKTHSEITKDED